MKEHLSGFWRENRRFLFLLVSIVFFKSAIADLNSISGRSMQPTLLDGDKVWVNKLAYDVRVPFTDLTLFSHSDPQRGDIVIIGSEVADKRLVKRVVGLPGDTVYMYNNTLVINGEAADYQVLAEDERSTVILEQLLEHSHQAMVSEGAGRPQSYGPVLVPEDEYFVLGDNRDNSADSRLYSFIPREEIIGRSNSVVFSLDSEHYYLPRPDRFMAELQ